MLKVHLIGRLRHPTFYFGQPATSPINLVALENCAYLGQHTNHASQFVFGSVGGINDGPNWYKFLWSIERKDK